MEGKFVSNYSKPGKMHSRRKILERSVANFHLPLGDPLELSSWPEWLTSLICESSVSTVAKRPPNGKQKKLGKVENCSIEGGDIGWGTLFRESL